MNCAGLGRKYRAVLAPENHQLPLLGISALARHRQMPQHPPAKRSVRNLQVARVRRSVDAWHVV